MRNEPPPAFGATPLPPDIAPLGHAHVFLGASHDANARRTGWVVALTATMMVAEIVAGIWTGSMALLTDGLHMATHAGVLGMAALAYAFARRHATNPAFSFGTGKVGELAGFASALLLGILEQVMGRGGGLEPVGRLRIAGSEVGVALAGDPLVGLLDLVRRRRLRQTEGGIWILRQDSASLTCPGILAAATGMSTCNPRRTPSKQLISKEVAAPRPGGAPRCWTGSGR